MSGSVEIGLRRQQRRTRLHFSCEVLTRVHIQMQLHGCTYKVALCIWHSRKGGLCTRGGSQIESTPGRQRRILLLLGTRACLELLDSYKIWFEICLPHTGYQEIEMAGTIAFARARQGTAWLIWLFDSSKVKCRIGQVWLLEMEIRQSFRCTRPIMHHGSR